MLAEKVFYKKVQALYPLKTLCGLFIVQNCNASNKKHPFCNIFRQSAAALNERFIFISYNDLSRITDVRQPKIKQITKNSCKSDGYSV